MSHFNIEGDPLFARGRLGNYYLSQIAAGQLADSNAVNAGSTTAVNAGMNIYSTRTDNTFDTGQVDLGYHSKDTEPINYYWLTTSVAPAGRGTIVPAPGAYYKKQYTQVALTATASDSRYRFKAWYGTDNDAKKEVNPANGAPLTVQHNVVTMGSDRDVTAEFETKMVMLIVTVTSANGTVQKSPPPDDPRRDSYYLRGTVVTLTAHSK